jgi:NADPH:quinone reductase-like Zn-dependent oxidoreductase
MNAIEFRRFGEPGEVLSQVDAILPSLGPGEVQVRMLAAPINPSDMMVIRGVYGMLPTLPATPGLEGVGIVEKAQAGLLGRYLVGKRVCVLNGRTGTWADYCIARARQVIPVPSSVSDEQSAMFFVNPATALLMTKYILRVRPGDWLIQTAAASAVGTMVIRLGKHLGFRTINLVRRVDQIEPLKSLGADAVLLSDSKNLVEQIQQLTDGASVRHALDPVGGELGSGIIKCLAENGTMLVYGSLANQPTCFDPRNMLTRNISIRGFWLGRHMASLHLLSKLALVREVGSLIKKRVLSCEPGYVFSLDQIDEAVRVAERPGRSGKVLLRMGP